MPEDQPPSPPDGEDESATDDTSAPDLPTDVAEEAARLTRLALETADHDSVEGPFQEAHDSTAQPAEADLYRTRRDEFLEGFGYVARVRKEPEGGATLVCYPDDWLDEDGVVRIEADLDTDRAIERSLAGPGEQGDFESAVEANDILVQDVRDEYGDVHAENVRAFADFMSNHYARAVTTASAAEVREFIEEYYPRNAWPTETQAELVDASLRYAFEVRNERFPLD